MAEVGQQFGGEQLRAQISGRRLDEVDGRSDGAALDPVIALVNELV
ncbi:hypothetical protein ACQP1G_20805 [Nocardia sp. CA-107356]